MFYNKQTMQNATGHDEDGNPICVFPPELEENGTLRRKLARAWFWYRWAVLTPMPANWNYDLDA